MHVDLVERRDQRVHVDDRDAGIDHLLDRRGERADAEGLDGDEVPFLARHIVDRGALLGGGKLAVEPGHLDVEELAPVFGRLLALRAPGRLQAGIGEGRLQRLLRSAGHLVGERRRDAEGAQQRDPGEASQWRATSRADWGESLSSLHDSVHRPSLLQLDSEHRFRSSGNQPTAEGQPLLLRACTHKRASVEPLRGMSALPPIADESGGAVHVR